MPDGYHFCFLDPLIDDEETVLKIRKKALELYAEGKVVMEWSGEGTTSKKAFVAPIESILMETRRCLKLMNPSQYGSVVRQSNVIRIA